ncbi:unnamed protein product [Rhizophagus irregularis]|nr:unnamed protein product [Rhizophagus irregularis]
MACSKIFLGELPELLSEIIQYFRSDFSTLHSCSLVSRLWCRLAIPLLWENPFSIIPNKNYYSIEYHKIRFIETYLVKLNDNDKIKLYEFGINNLTPNTLFNYPSFIQYLDTRLISVFIEKWVVAVKKNENPSFTLIRNTQNLDFIKFIYKSLIKIFIENEAIIHTFDVKNRHKYFDVISELVLQSSNFICNIKNLYLEPYYSFKIGNINPLLKFLSSNCNSISSLYIPSFNKHKDSNTLIEYLSQLSQLIKSQKNLSKILFFYDFPHLTQNIYPAINLIKNIQQNLNYLTIDLDYDFGTYFCNSDAEISSIVLQNLGQILPPKLEYLNMSLVINTNDFVIFLKNSHNTFIKKLIFSNIINGIREEAGQDDMLYNIKEYIMKKKRVKYFAFQNLFIINDDHEELFYLKDEVKEFKLHDIIVKNYNDLKIGEFIEFLKEEIN